MKLLRKLLKIAGFSFLSILFLIGLYVLTALIFSMIPVNSQPKANGSISIFILSNGVHTDIVVPGKTPEINWYKKIKFMAPNQDHIMKYIGFGWGDKEFYLKTPTWSDLKFKTAFQAIFGAGGAAIHTTFYKTVKVGPDCIKINLSKTQYLRLIHYIKSSFLKNISGNYIRIKAHGYGAYDAFYDAGGRYNLFKTCNSWTNDGLKICGQKACLWTPFAQGIFYQYRRNNKSSG